MTGLRGIGRVESHQVAPVPALTRFHAAALARLAWPLAPPPTVKAQSVSVSGDTVWESTQDALLVYQRDNLKLPTAVNVNPPSRLSSHILLTLFTIPPQSPATPHYIVRRQDIT